VLLPVVLPLQAPLLPALMLPAVLPRPVLVLPAMMVPPPPRPTVVLKLRCEPCV